MLRFGHILSRGLIQRGHQVEVCSPSPKFTRLAPNYHYSGWPKLLGYIDKFVLFPATLRRVTRRLQPDAVHLLDHANAVYARAVQSCPTLATCHDLLQLQLALGLIEGPRPRPMGRMFQKWILRHLRHLPHTVCVSTKTQDDFLQLTHKDASASTVVHNGLNHPFRRQSIATAQTNLARVFARKQLKIDPPTNFVFHLGGTQWYKNREGLLEIYAHLRRHLSEPPILLLAGKPLSSSALTRITALGLAAVVFQLGPVSPTELEALYSLADGLLFPSWAEGFGWPVAEAHACGCPVFTSNRPPLTEVGGDAAVYFDPVDPAAAARIIAAAWPRRKQLSQAGLARAQQWQSDRMIAGYEAVYRRLLTVASKP